MSVWEWVFGNVCSSASDPDCQRVLILPGISVWVGAGAGDRDRDRECDRECDQEWDRMCVWYGQKIPQAFIACGTARNLVITLYTVYTI